MAGKNNARNTVRDGNNGFAKHLYKILSREPGNLIFSPISIHAILSLMSQGSVNQTKAAFTDALKVPDLNMAAKSYKNIMSHLNSIKGVTLLMANNLFLNENYELQNPFAATAKDNFMAEVKLVDFSKSEAAAGSINDWVEKKTNIKFEI
ncbi:hypothetical protein NQ318_000804 [Aromia moschata]|uniref:Serpin domain-containing protein n=1 Tax=Aromia moschata TaxID=1265417 RepID=A0AAV8X295_9CUCU|nr:hypothetical protein NQ318_000804 [Aromia moschata]